MVTYLFIFLFLIAIIQLFISINSKEKLRQSNVEVINALERKMKIPSIPIQIFGEGIVPKFMTDGAVGADCFARLDLPLTIKKGETALINLGFGMKIPYGYKAEILPRSGLSKKLILIPGEIDQDYTGEIKARFWNVGEDYTFKPNERICQIEIIPIVKPSLYQVNKLEETERGDKGFGSTGK